MNDCKIVIWLAFALIFSNGCSVTTSEFGNRLGSSGDIPYQGRWACSQNFQITVNQQNQPQQNLTTGHKDFKPSWSMTDGKLTFFRRISKGQTGFTSWRTRICVINADGIGLKELTSGDYPDLNPTWTRDGSNMIIFNRLATVPSWENQIYLISPDGAPGDELLISNPSETNYEWANSALKDGRIFIDRFNSDYAKSFLLTPNPGKLGNYEEIERPDERLWHKLSISPDETKVAYMLDNDRKLWTYNDAVIAIAEFDSTKLIVHNPTIITEKNLENVYEYPRWTEDGQYLVYDSNKSGKFQVYAYHLESKKTFNISPNKDGNYRFAHCENMPK